MLIWKEFCREAPSAPIDKLFIIWRGQRVYMRRYDGRGNNILFNEQWPNVELGPTRGYDD